MQWNQESTLSPEHPYHFQINLNLFWLPNLVIYLMGTQKDEAAMIYFPTSALDIFIS